MAEAKTPNQQMARSPSQSVKSLRRRSSTTSNVVGREDTKKKKTEFKNWLSDEMVQDVELEHDGELTMRKVLFMPNEYVSRFNATNISKVIKHLGLRERPSNFVITLLPSMMGAKDFEVTPQSITEPKNLGEQADYAEKRPPSHAKGDALVTETQTMLFVEHCILPVAMKARALIIISGTNDCSLAVAVQNIMGPIQKNMGEKCPFTIVGYCSMQNLPLLERAEAGEQNEEVDEHHSRSNSNSLPSKPSLAGTLCYSSKKLNKKDSSFFVNFQKAGNNEQENKHKKFLANHSRDINPICTRIILFESITITRDGDNLNPSFDDRSRPFMNLLLEHLDAQYPSLAIQA